MPTNEDKKPAARGRPKISPPALEPLNAESSEPIDKQVYQSVRRALMSGALVPGSRLSSRSIASALGVSPMPVREALKRLDADGVISSAAKSGFVVKDITADEYKEILALRLNIEGVLIREAAKNITQAEIEQAQWLLDRIKASQKWEHILQYNYQLHFLAYKAARMPYALSIVENMWLKVGPAFHRLPQKTQLNKSIKLLTALVTALSNGDKDAAEKHLCADIEINASALLSTLEKREEESAA